jgi:hypothetical protein
MYGDEADSLADCRLAGALWPNGERYRSRLMLTITGMYDARRIACAPHGGHPRALRQVEIRRPRSSSGVIFSLAAKAASLR